MAFCYVIIVTNNQDHLLNRHINKNNAPERYDRSGAFLVIFSLVYQ